MNRTIATILIAAAILPACVDITIGDGEADSDTSTSDTSTTTGAVGVTGDGFTSYVSTSSGDTSSGEHSTSSGDPSTTDDGSGTTGDPGDCELEVFAGLLTCMCNGIPSHDPADCGCVWPSPGVCVCDGVEVEPDACNANCVPGVPCWCSDLVPPQPCLPEPGCAIEPATLFCACGGVPTSGTECGCAMTENGACECDGAILPQGTCCYPSDPPC